MLEKECLESMMLAAPFSGAQTSPGGCCKSDCNLLSEQSFQRKSVDKNSSLKYFRSVF